MTSKTENRRKKNSRKDHFEMCIHMCMKQYVMTSWIPTSLKENTDNGRERHGGERNMSWNINQRGKRHEIGILPRSFKYITKHFVEYLLKNSMKSESFIIYIEFDGDLDQLRPNCFCLEMAAEYNNKTSCGVYNLLFKIFDQCATAAQIIKKLWRNKVKMYSLIITERF